MGKRPVSALTLDIAYRDAKDTPSWRRIDVKGLSEFGEYLYLEAWCHLRADNRSFRIDRIAEIVTPETGEVIYDVPAFLARFTKEQLAPGRDQASVMSRARTGLVPLIWIARADYQLSDSEMDLLVSYVADRNLLSGSRYLTAEWNRALVRRWIEAQTPTLENARGAIAGMTKDGREKELVAKYAAQLVALADGDGGLTRRVKTLGLDGR